MDLFKLKYVLFDLLDEYGGVMGAHLNYSYNMG